MAHWKIAAISFDHMHLDDLVRQVQSHPEAELVALIEPDPARLRAGGLRLGIPLERQFLDLPNAFAQTRPDLAILCAATAEHASWTEKIAPFGVHLMVEKPFAATLAEADRMIAAQSAAGKILAINWPSRWSAAINTAKDFLDQGLIGEILQFHFLGGNRGPLFHLKEKLAAPPTREDKNRSWFYQKARGGGSLLDYAGYGATLGTWYLNGRKPLEVTAVVDQPAGLEVDEQSVIVCRYASGLSKIETHWGTFTDPWIQQPQPRCGFTFSGSAGTLRVEEHARSLRIQTVDHPEGYDLPVVDVHPPFQTPIQYLLHCLETGQPVNGPLSPALARIGQQILESAIQSAQQKRTLPLLDSKPSDHL